MTKAKQIIKAWAAREGRKITWLAASVPMDRSHLSSCMAGRYVPREVYRNRIAAVVGDNGLCDKGAWE